MKTKQEVIASIQAEVAYLAQYRDNAIANNDTTQKDKEIVRARCNNKILAYQHCLELIEQLPD